MTAVGLIFGRLTAEHYEDETARDPRIDALREKMTCVEDKRFSAEYLDPEKRSIANGVQVFFKDGSCTEEVVVEYPLGHPYRRAEGIPLLVEKFKANLARRFSPAQQEAILEASLDQEKLEEMPVNEYVDLYCP
jgi:2-methylcitrate dehydratase